MELAGRAARLDGFVLRGRALARAFVRASLDLAESFCGSGTFGGANTLSEPRIHGGSGCFCEFIGLDLVGGYLGRLARTGGGASVSSRGQFIRVVVLHIGDVGAEGESFFLNALLIQFGLPSAAACILAWQSGVEGFERLRRVYQLAAMLLGFIWATFLVQDFFGGSELFDRHNSSTEIYTYSVVWLLLAVVYQAIGIWRNQSAIHVGSLVLLLITIGKVFLVDASELEGLFRVLSFLGLGLALIGVGFFYNKVVFARREAA